MQPTDTPTTDDRLTFLFAHFTGQARTYDNVTIDQHQAGEVAVICKELLEARRRIEEQNDLFSVQVNSAAVAKRQIRLLTEIVQGEIDAYYEEFRAAPARRLENRLAEALQTPEGTNDATEG